MFATRVSRDPRQVAFFDEFRSLGSRVILNGHFIDPRFFAGNEPAIRSDLCLKDDVLGADSHYLRVLDDIRASESPVAVHVRRGELLLPNNAWWRLPRMETYYSRAFGAIAQGVSNPSLWVFSDDPEWCRSEFSSCALPATVISSEENHDPLKEFYLMTRCKHHVIANSAFSWWSAWLSPHADKKVFVPYRWDMEGIIDMQHFIPMGWKAIEW